MKKSTVLLIILLAIFFLIGCKREGPPETRERSVSGLEAGDEFELLRQNMVKNQLEKRGIKDLRVLAAMGKVKREDFVPNEMRAHAYNDSPLPIEKGQTISQPFIVALMTEALKLGKEDRILEIGTGSGYQAAILAELVKEVFTIEIVPELAISAKKRLKKIGYVNIEVKLGDGYKGWQEKAPFDAIIITAAVDHIPKPLQDQLGEGGKIILPHGDPLSTQSLHVFTKKSGKMEKEFITNVMFVPMTGKALKEP